MDLLANRMDLLANDLLLLLRFLHLLLRCSLAPTFLRFQVLRMHDTIRVLRLALLRADSDASGAFQLGALLCPLALLLLLRLLALLLATNDGWLDTLAGPFFHLGHLLAALLLLGCNLFQYPLRLAFMR